MNLHANVYCKQALTRRRQTFLTPPTDLASCPWQLASVTPLTIPHWGKHLHANQSSERERGRERERISDERERGQHL